MATEKENTLGAPTVGLGQNITFQFDPGSAQPRADYGTGTRTRAGVQGGGGSMSSRAVQGDFDLSPDPTMAAIGKLLGRAADKEIEQKQVEQMFRGAQRAMAGEAITSIVNEQPWYTRIFGDSDVVEGARQYKASAVASEAALEIQDEMPSIRALSGQAAQDYFVQKYKSKMTGDRATDSAITGGLMRTLPALMAAQTKENYKWMQEEATKAEAAHFQSSAAVLQDAASRAASDPSQADALKGMTKQFLSGVIPVNGRDLDSWEVSVASGIIMLADNGQLHAVSALRSAGLFESLSDKSRTAIERKINAGEKKLVEDYSIKWMEDIAALKANADGNPLDPLGAQPKSVIQRMNELNDKFMKATGSSQPLFGGKEQISLTEQSYNAVQAAEAARLKEARKEANARRSEITKAQDKEAAEKAALDAKVAAESQTRQAIAKGDYTGLLTADVPKSEIAKQWVSVYDKTLAEDAKENARLQPGQRPINRAAELLVQVGNSIGIPEQFKAAKRAQVVNAMRGGVAGGTVDTASAVTAYSEWKKLSDHPGTGQYVSEVYGDEFHTRMRKFDMLYNDNPAQLLGAYQQAFVDPISRTTLSKEQSVELGKQVADASPAALRTGLGNSVDIAPESSGKLTALVRNRLEMLGGLNGLDDDRQISNAINGIIGPNGSHEMIGGYIAPVPRGGKRLRTMLKEAGGGMTSVFDEAALARVSDEVVAEAIKTYRIDAGAGITILRAGTNAGVTTFQILGADGQVGEFTSREIHARLTEHERSVKSRSKEFDQGLSIAP